jgi:hypothetical protein
VESVEDQSDIARLDVRSAGAANGVDVFCSLELEQDVLVARSAGHIFAGAFGGAVPSFQHARCAYVWPTAEFAVLQFGEAGVDRIADRETCAVPERRRLTATRWATSPAPPRGDLQWWPRRSASGGYDSSSASPQHSRAASRASSNTDSSYGGKRSARSASSRSVSSGFESAVVSSFDM